MHLCIVAEDAVSVLKQQLLYLVGLIAEHRVASSTRARASGAIRAQVASQRDNALDIKMSPSSVRLAQRHSNPSRDAGVSSNGGAAIPCSFRNRQSTEKIRASYFFEMPVPSWKESPAAMSSRYWEAAFIALSIPVLSSLPVFTVSQRLA
jgi:hypothetical protein